MGASLKILSGFRTHGRFVALNDSSMGCWNHSIAASTLSILTRSVNPATVSRFTAFLDRANMVTPIIIRTMGPMYLLLVIRIWNARNGTRRTMYCAEEGYRKTTATFTSSMTSRTLSGSEVFDVLTEFPSSIDTIRMVR